MKETVLNDGVVIFSIPAQQLGNLQKLHLQK